MTGQLPMDFMLPKSDWTVPKELPDLRGAGVIGIDSETRDDGLSRKRGPGWVYKAGWVAGVSVASARGSVYIPLRHPDTENFDPKLVARWLQDHLDSDDEKVFQNAPYDVGWLTEDLGVSVRPGFHDTLAMAYMLDEQRLTYNLDSLCKWQGVPGKDERMLVEAARAYGLNPKSELWKLPARYVGPYADQDAVSTLGLFHKMKPQLIGQEVYEAYQLEQELIPMVLAMRRRGIRFNVDRASESRDRLLARRDEALAEISRRLAIGREIAIGDVRSPRFMEKVFQSEGLHVPKTEKGNPSFESEWMSKSEHWLPNLAARAIKMDDAGEKFISGYLIDYTHRGRIHAEIHQYRSDEGGTKTSRFSYSDPPLQQMPSRDAEIAQEIRGAFEPEDGEVWGSIDYSQQEYRLIVHFAHLCRVAGADRSVSMYRENPRTDFHSMVAEMTGLPRKKAKDVNFAKAFGAGVPKFALMTGMSLDEAAATMSQYDEEAPFVKRLSEYVQVVASRRGYIRLLDGARARFDRWEPRWVDYKKHAGTKMPMGACSREEAMERMRDPNHPWSGNLRRAFTHKAMNWLIQGSAARMTKLAMRACWRENILPLIQVHDELGFSFSDERTARRAEELMRDTVRLEVPVVVDAEYGRTWGDSMVSKLSFEETLRSVRG